MSMENVLEMCSEYGYDRSSHPNIIMWYNTLEWYQTSIDTSHFIINLTVCWTACSGLQQRKIKDIDYWPILMEIYRWPVAPFTNMD